MECGGGQFNIDVVSFAFARYGEYDVEKPIYIDASNQSSHITARRALTLVRQLIAGLKAQGLQKGDCICLHTFNNVFYAPLWLATVGAGGVVSGVNPACTVSELVHHLSITTTKYIIAQQNHLENICEAAKQCGVPDARIFVLDAFVGPTQYPVRYKSWKILLGFGEDDWVRLHNEDEQRATTAALASTSGTTGLPKAAKISHRYLVTQSKMIHALKRRCTHEVTQLVCLPLFHAFAAQLSLVLPLRDGTPTYLMPRFKLPEFVDLVQRFQITDVAIVPPIIATLLHLDDEGMSGLRSLRYVLCAGAPTNAEVQAKLCRALHPKGIVAQVWGTTETGWISAFGPMEQDSSGSVGRLLDHVELKVIDENGLSRQEGKHGEACVRTPSLYSGYLGPSISSNPELDDEGYYHTGDRAYIHDGKVFIDGRIKDIMKVNGWQVSPAELEAIIIQYRDILDVAVAGKELINKDGLKETLPQAFVVRRHLAGEDRPPILEEDVKNFVAENVISYKRLTGGVVFVDKIPRNPTGKVLRRTLLAIGSEGDDEKPLVIDMPSELEACPPELGKKSRRSFSAT